MERQLGGRIWYCSIMRIISLAWVDGVAFRLFNYNGFSDNLAI
jgi:hypothetical protein